MNPFFLFAVVVASATAQQEQCGCAPQPVTIQLSCGGKNQGGPPPQRYPPPPPPPPSAYWRPSPPASNVGDNIHNDYGETTSTALYETETSVRPTGPFSRVQDDPRRDECVWQSDGIGNYFISWNVTSNGHPGSYHTYIDEWDNPTADKYSNIKWYFAPDNTKPPRGWDGSFASLPYPKPEEDSLLYWWLLCYPLIPRESASQEPSILDDPNRGQCKWEIDYEKYDVDVNGENIYYGYPKGNLAGGFPSPFRLVDRLSWDNKKGVETPPGVNLPPHDWDGRESSLGFPLPPKNTPEYNMLLCWPYDFNVNSRAPVHAAG